MKRLLIVLASCFLVSVSAHAQQNTPAISLLESYEDCKDFKYIEMAGHKLNFAKPFIKRTPAGALIDKTKGLYMCIVDERNAEEAKGFQSKADSVFRADYTLLAEQDFNGTFHSIFIDGQDLDAFSEVVMLTKGKGKVSAFVFYGNYDKECLEEMARTAAEQEGNVN